MFAQLFDLSGLSPHGTCLLWRPELFWSMAAADSAIALAYILIGSAIWFFIVKRRDVELRNLGALFAAFILFCAASHVSEVWTLWSPDYGVQILLKLGTAIISLVTAGLMWKLMPDILTLPSVRQMEAANRSLGIAQDDLTQAQQSLEQKVEERTAELQDKTHELHLTIAELAKSNAQLEAVREELENLVQHDTLTGVWNRRKIRETAQLEMLRKSRYGYPVSMIFVDLDHFKQINDQYGHAVGDDVLRDFCKVAQNCMRSTDLLGRWGGEEFVIITPHSGLMIAIILAERICNALMEHKFPSVGRMTASFGVATCDKDESWESWFSRADTALYAAKERGRNRVVADKAEMNEQDRNDALEPSYLRLAWGGTYESGNLTIDEQHRNIFDHVNALMAAVLAEQTKTEIMNKVEDLLAILVTHFQDEEDVFRKINYAEAEDHTAIHKKLIDSTIKHLDDYRSGKSVIGELFNFLAYEVVANHMFTEDRKLSDLFNNGMELSRATGTGAA